MDYGPFPFPQDGSAAQPALTLWDLNRDHRITLRTLTDEADHRFLTVPALGGDKTLAMIDLAQTFSAIQLFNYGMFKLNDVSDNHKVLVQPSEEAADRTLTIPVLGGNKTLAMIDLAQTFSAIQLFNYGQFKLNDVSDN